MKKILILTNHSYMLYRFRRGLIQELMKKYTVVLSMPFVGHHEDFQAMGIRCIETKVNRRGMNPVEDGKLFRTYQKLLREERPDLVITYSIKPNIYGAMACALVGIPCYVNIQGLGTAFQKQGVSTVATVLYRKALRKAKVVFFENEGNARTFVERRIIKADKIKILPGAGIDLQEFPLTAYPENQQFRFLYLGRIMKEKGIDELFAAMWRLHETLGDRVVLDLVGFYEDDYHQQIRELVDAGVAVFHDFQSEPRPYYQAADCLVLPSYHEGMSNVLLEAAATGRPVITSNIHGCLEAVTPEKTGLLCEAQDVDSLYEKMLDMVNLPRAAREQMGLAAREKMEREFDKKLVIQETIQTIFSNYEEKTTQTQKAGSR